MVRVDLTETETVEQQVNVGQPEEAGGRGKGQRRGPGQEQQVGRVPRGKGSMVDRRPPGGLGVPSEMPAFGGV